MMKMRDELKKKNVGALRTLQGGKRGRRRYELNKGCRKKKEEKKKEKVEQKEKKEERGGGGRGGLNEVKRKEQLVAIMKFMRGVTVLLSAAYHFNSFVLMEVRALFLFLPYKLFLFHIFFFFFKRKQQQLYI